MIFQPTASRGHLMPRKVSILVQHCTITDVIEYGTGKLRRNASHKRCTDYRITPSAFQHQHLLNFFALALRSSSKYFRKFNRNSSRIWTLPVTSLFSIYRRCYAILLLSFQGCPHHHQRLWHHLRNLPLQSQHLAFGYQLHLHWCHCRLL